MNKIAISTSLKAEARSKINVQQWHGDQFLLEMHNDFSYSEVI